MFSTDISVVLQQNNTTCTNEIGMNESSQLSWDLGDFDNSADFVGNDEIMHEMDDEGPYLEDIHLVSNEDGVLYAEEDENNEEGLVDENIIMMQEPIAEDPFHIYHAVMPHKATDHHPTSPDLYRETHSASSHTKTGHEREARPRSLYRHVSWSTPRRVVSPGQSVLDTTAFSFSSQMVASPSPISGVAGGTTPSSSGDFQESLQQLAACLRQSEVTRKMIMYQQHRQQSNGSAFSGPFSVDETRRCLLSSIQGQGDGYHPSGRPMVQRSQSASVYKDAVRPSPLPSTHRGRSTPPSLEF